jgi:hypothetical protein
VIACPGGAGRRDVGSPHSRSVRRPRADDHTIDAGDHDFLEQPRHPVSWTKAKKTIVEADVGASIEALKAALSHLTPLALAKVMTG